jgi:hypothetical protein
VGDGTDTGLSDALTTGFGGLRQRAMLGSFDGPLDKE